MTYLAFAVDCRDLKTGKQKLTALGGNGRIKNILKINNIICKHHV
jgi:hypothetical protein